MTGPHGQDSVHVLPLVFGYRRRSSWPAGMPAALIYGPMQALQHVECAGAGRRDWTARLVNGFVNETRRNCPFGVGRGVKAWTSD